MSEAFLHILRVKCGCKNWWLAMNGEFNAVTSGPRVPYEEVIRECKSKLEGTDCGCVITGVNTRGIVMSQEMAQELDKGQLPGFGIFFRNIIPL